MITLYAIKSLANNFRYIGITNNLKRRFNQHNKGYNQSTVPYRPFQLIYSEESNSYKEARIREKFFKSGIGRDFLDRIKIA